MTLREWMAQSKTTQSELARVTGIDQSLISKYLKRKRRPSGPNIAAIAEATSGAVGLTDWPGCRGKKRAA